jgi:hypothetical protein
MNQIYGTLCDALINMSPWHRCASIPVVHQPEPREISEFARAVDTITPLFHEKGIQHSVTSMRVRGKAVLDAIERFDEASLVGLLENGPIFDEDRVLAVKCAADKHYVSIGRYETIVDLLLVKGQISDKHLGLVMKWAAGSDRRVIVERLLATDRIFDNKQLLEEMLICASRVDRLEIVELLLRTHQISDEGRKVAIDVASARSYFRIVHLLKFPPPSLNRL